MQNIAFLGRLLTFHDVCTVVFFNYNLDHVLEDVFIS